MDVQGETEKIRILVGCTGSVASIKIPQLIQGLTELKHKVEVKLVATEHSLHFFDSTSIPLKVYRDEDEWQQWQKRNDPVLHIELRRWADMMLIAPLDANTLAKIANGICDNLLTCIVRAWDLKHPLLFAPAMNTYMWDHPLTGRHIKTLQEFGYTEIPCIEKTLMCGDKGFGAMAEVPAIIQKVEQTIEYIKESR